MKTIITVEQCVSHQNYDTRDSFAVRVECPDGMKECVKLGARPVEHLDSYDSRTGSNYFHYEKWKIEFPNKMLKDLANGSFCGMRPLCNLDWVDALPN